MNTLGVVQAAATSLKGDIRIESQRAGTMAYITFARVGGAGLLRATARLPAMLGVASWGVE